jgi:hypothetical protein
MRLQTFLAGLLVAAWPAAAQAVTLQSHVGVYDLTMSRNRSDSGLSGVHGRLVLQVLEACNGYEQSQRMVLITTGTDGQELTRDFNFESWESTDGTQLRFDSADAANGNLQSRHVGHAKLDRRGGEGRVVFDEPEGETDIPLAEGTIFPTEHFVVLIEAALRGETNVVRRVFDGSGPNGLYDAVAWIAPPSGPTRDRDVVDLLGKGQAWNVHLAYFKPATNEFLPEYEIAFRLHDNGVASDLELDYGSFALRASLSQLDYLPRKC